MPTNPAENKLIREGMNADGAEVIDNVFLYHLPQALILSPVPHSDVDLIRNKLAEWATKKEDTAEEVEVYIAVRGECVPLQPGIEAKREQKQPSL